MSNKLSDIKEFAIQEPRITILNDAPINESSVEEDSFNLAVKLAPIYDILRHHKTQTPMSIAIYGDWGSGKTSGMRWLHGLLNKWNDHLNAKVDKSAKGKRVHAIWFYPWKYQTQEDVWRGLISEVILESIKVENITTDRACKAVKEFSLYLGRSFVHAASGIIGGKTAQKTVSDIFEDYAQINHPEKAYLNEFEAKLQMWVKETLGNNDRMVIFIDDLDRCLPEVALQVLEALKLYLNIENLIFIVGVDRDVIDQLVKKHYASLGLKEGKSKHYLAKMFQVEVTMSPSNIQAKSFLTEQLNELLLESNSYWQEKLTGKQQGIFHDTILKRAERNPREIKRYINSMLIHGAGALHAKSENNETFSFAQGVQVFLIRKILDEEYTAGLMVETENGKKFLWEWSSILEKNQRKSPIVSRIKEYLKALEGNDDEQDKHNHMIDKIPEHFLPIIKNQSYRQYREILDNSEIAKLLSIGLYPKDSELLLGEISNDINLNDRLIQEAIAKWLKKKPDEVTSSDYPKVTHLTLTGKEVYDISLLSMLTNLMVLKLVQTSINDITPISELTQLSKLDLSGVNINEITPLSKLVQLELLILPVMKINDFTPLSKLTRLSELYLAKTGINDLQVISELNQLTGLYLSGTAISDLTPISGLSKLKTLDLSDTKISDIPPLSGLTKLERLRLMNTEVENISALSGLSKLRQLFLVGTKVRDLSPVLHINGLKIIGKDELQQKQSSQ